MATERNDYELELPRLGSLILTHTWNGAIKGLKTVPASQRPYVPIVFFAFRIMVGLGMLMFATGVVGLVLRSGGALYRTRWFLRLMVAMAPAGFIALLAGWTVTETGRQPYTVYGLLRTADSASPIAAAGVATSLVAFAVVYIVVFGAGVLMLLRMMARPPLPGERGPPATPIRSAGITPGPAGAAPGAGGGTLAGAGAGE
jgi:cytochrome d ubiquinol oxidase subunit I